MTRTASSEVRAARNLRSNPASPAWAAVLPVLLLACPSAEPDRDRRVDAGIDPRTDAGEGGEGGDAGADGGSDCVGLEPPTTARACRCPGDCESPESCISEGEFGLPGGGCLRICRGQDDCPETTTCDPGIGCLQTCASTANCRPGWMCSRVVRGDSESPLACTPYCQADSDCSELGTCDRYTGTCGDLGHHPGPGGLHAACDTDNDCISEFCGQGANFPGGYCTAFCSIERQGCPEDGVCIPQGAGDDDLGACFQRCEDDSECRVDEGYECAYWSRDSDERICATVG